MVATRRKGFAALLTAVFIWASTFVATKDALLAFPAGTLAVLRFVLALVVLFPLYLRRRPRSPAVPVKTAVLLGFFGVFLYFALQNWGL
ncbi:MAG TPA: EamA family transporter, partial [Firmicutes bacterium]|nr:EamA family transporter [Bacillota bacterium]